MTEVDKSKSESFTILNGKCHVFERPGSPFWWCGFYFKGKYLRSSTKEKNREAAESFAHKWYFQQQTEIASGSISSPKHTFGKIAKSALINYKGLVDNCRTSVAMIEQSYARYLGGSLMPNINRTGKLDGWDE